jgi:hypothetical protein
MIVIHEGIESSITHPCLKSYLDGGAAVKAGSAASAREKVKRDRYIPFIAKTAHSLEGDCRRFIGRVLIHKIIQDSFEVMLKTISFGLRSRFHCDPSGAYSSCPAVQETEEEEHDPSKNQHFDNNRIAGL